MTDRPNLAAAIAGLERAAKEVDGTQAPELLGELERVKGIVWARLVAASAGTPAVSAPADQAMLILDVQAAARFLAISPTKLRRLVADGAVPSVRVGRRLLFRRATLNRFATDREGFGGGRG